MSSAGLLSENENTFTIDGRVGYDLTDSLYVVYMADTAEELNNVRDSDFVAYMPVVNKRFSFSVQLDKRKVGRIRTVMPDGSLCELWTNLDFVPGETYRITTHNGYYDEDRDYEQRVGRYSGKSLLNDLQKRGIDDQTVVVTDEVPEQFSTVASNPRQDWRSSLTAQQQAQIQLRTELVQMEMEKIKATFENAAQGVKGGKERYGWVYGFDGTVDIDYDYKRIYQQNKELDKKYQDVIKLAKSFAIPSTEMPGLYKEILKFYNEQNQGLIKLSTSGAALTKQAKKTQKLVNDLMEKYIKEMEISVQF